MQEEFAAWMLKMGEVPEDYGLGEHSHPVIFFIWQAAWQACSRQPEQVSEPVAWMMEHDETGRHTFVANDRFGALEQWQESNSRWRVAYAMDRHRELPSAAIVKAWFCRDLFYSIESGTYKTIDEIQAALARMQHNYEVEDSRMK